jgi:hypothetical protein
MPKESTLSLDPTGDNFTLRRTAPDGSTATMVLTGQDVITLAASAIHLQQAILARHAPEGADIAPVGATDVAQFALNHEVLGENILLTLIAPAGSRATFAIPRTIAQLLVDRLPVHLAQMAAKSLSRQ